MLCLAIEYAIKKHSVSVSRGQTAVKCLATGQRFTIPGTNSSLVHKSSLKLHHFETIFTIFYGEVSVSPHGCKWNRINHKLGISLGLSVRLGFMFFRQTRDIVKRC